jgi:hypothetical protein
MMSTETSIRKQNRLSRADREALETRKALQWAGDKLRHEGRTSPSLNVLVWRCLQDAAETLARLPDRERTWLLSADRSGWPEVIHTAKERFEAELQRLTDVKMSKEEMPLPRLAITDPTATNRMLTVLSWLRHVRGKYVRNNQMVVLALAQGQPYRAVRRFMPRSDCTDFAITAVKGKVLKQIGHALAGDVN